MSREHADARRRQILEAAIDCFAEEGFHRTTMQHIIRRSRLSPGAIYRYFATKDDIIAAAADERHSRERSVMARAAAADEPRDALRSLAQAFFGALGDPEERKRRRVGVQVWAEALRDRRILRLMRRGLAGPRAAFADVVRSAQRRGELARTLDPDAVARAMASLFLGFVLQQAWDPGLRVAPYLDVVNAAIDGLLRRPARNGRSKR